LKAQIASLVASRAIGSAAQALLIVFLGRSVAPEIFGLAMVWFGVATLVLALSDLGMAQVVSLSRSQANLARLNAALGLNILTSVFACGFLVLVIILAVNGPSGFGIALIAIALAFEKCADTLQALPIADGRSMIVAGSFFVRRTVAAVCYLLMTVTFDEVDALTSFGLALVLGAALGYASLHFGVRRTLASVREGRYSESRVKHYSDAIRQGFPMLVGVGSMQLRGLDSTVIAAVASLSASGLYSAASKVVNPFYIIPSVLGQVMLPRAIGFDRRSIKRLSAALLAGGTAIAGVAAALAQLASDFMGWLFGGPYSSAGFILSAVLAGAAFFGASSVAGAVLQGRADARFVAVVGMASSVLMLGALALFTAMFGVFAGAVAAAGVFAAKLAVLTARLWFGAH